MYRRLGFRSGLEDRRPFALEEGKLAHFIRLNTRLRDQRRSPGQKCAL
jgi:hypothetical protein